MGKPETPQEANPYYNPDNIEVGDKWTQQCNGEQLLFECIGMGHFGPTVTCIGVYV